MFKVLFFWQILFADIYFVDSDMVQLAYSVQWLKTSLALVHSRTLCTPLNQYVDIDTKFISASCINVTVFVRARVLFNPNSMVRMKMQYISFYFVQYRKSTFQDCRCNVRNRMEQATHTMKASMNDEEYRSALQKPANK